MTDSTRYPVDRTIPPSALTRVGNPVLSGPRSGRRRAAKVDQALLVLRVTGRRTGCDYSTPGAFPKEGDGRPLVLNSSGRLVILRGASPGEDIPRRRRMAATAELQDDPLTVAEVHKRLTGEVMLTNAGRRLGIRSNIDRVPTREELTHAARPKHASALYLQLTGGNE